MAELAGFDKEKRRRKGVRGDWSGLFKLKIASTVEGQIFVARH